MIIILIIIIIVFIAHSLAPIHSYQTHTHSISHTHNAFTTSTSKLIQGEQINIKAEWKKKRMIIGSIYGCYEHIWHRRTGYSHRCLSRALKEISINWQWSGERRGTSSRRKIKKKEIITKETNERHVHTEMNGFVMYHLENWQWFIKWREKKRMKRKKHHVCSAIALWGVFCAKMHGSVCVYECDHFMAYRFNFCGIFFSTLATGQVSDRMR